MGAAASSGVVPRGDGIARTLTPTEFERRAARAELLAAQAPLAREPLLFAAKLCRDQGELVSKLDVATLTGHFADDVDRLMSLHAGILRLAAKHGPEELAEEASDRADEPPDTARARLLTFWNGDTTGREDYLSRALLRPYAEALRLRGATVDREHRRGHCPFCGGAASISARRALPDADGGLRLLGCPLCGCDWNFNRGCCPSCFEEDPYKLPLFSSEAYPNVRIEACETCHRYLKSIDLTKDARPIPEIDDLVSLAVDLWAVDEGYTRIEPGLAGI